MIRLSVAVTGPLVTDGVGIFKRNVRNLMTDIAEEAEAEVKSAMTEGAGLRRPITVGGGRVSDHVIGRTKSRSGRQWQYTATISVQRAQDAVENASLMAAAAQVEAQTDAFKSTDLGQAVAIRRFDTAKGLT